MAGAAKYAATAAFAVIVVVSGILHGRQTHRWSDPPPLDAFVARLKNVPEKFDDWSGTPTRFMDDLRAHGIEEYVLIDYYNNRGTEKYQVLIVVGRPGPIASHTPDVCYRGEGFTTNSEPKRTDFTIKEDGPNRGRTYPLFELKLRPPNTRVLDYELEVRWAWMPPSKGLMAPESPRVEFADQQALYKVYVIHKKPVSASAQLPSNSTAPVPTAPTSKAPVNDASAFLSKFLPRLEAALKDPEPAK